MASDGHHENGLSDDPVKNQVAAEDETGNDSDGVPTEHQEEANNNEIHHRFVESESSEENCSFSTTARWHQRFARARVLEVSCKDLSHYGKEEIFQELDKVSSCSKVECENKLCKLQRQLRMLIEEFYALSSSSVTGVEGGPQVEGGSQVENGLEVEGEPQVEVGSQVENGPEVEGGPQDSAEIIEIKKIFAAREAASRAREAALQGEVAASRAREAALQGKVAALQGEVVASRGEVAASRVRVAALQVTQEAYEIYNNHDHVKNVLGGVSRGSNETHFTIGTLRSKQEELAACAVSLDASRFEPTQPPSPDAVDELMQNCAYFKVDGQNPHDLSHFVCFLQNVLKKSKVSEYNYNSKQYSSHIQQTVKAIVNWKTDTNGRVPALYKPSWKGHETRGAHPILCAIMWKIGDMCNGNKHFFREQFVPKEGTRSPRFVDVVISDVVEFVRATIPALLDVPLEIKPTAREKVPLANLLVQGENQIIGHLAKMLIEAFHFGGIGANRVVRGVVMTMVSVEIVEMKLSGMGTAEVKLETRKTGHEPLFDMDTTLDLLDDMKEKSSVVQNCLKQFTEGDSPQEGFLLLQALLSGLLEHHEPTFSAYSDQTSNTSIQLGRLLGSGAFSSVYALKEDGETFLKTPKSRRCVKALENEAEALKALDHPCIPKVFLKDAPYLGILTVQLLCDTSVLPSLRLKGLIGTPASKVNVENLKDDDLQRIIEDIISALKYTHAQGWVHLDVRPSNIIISQLGNVSPRVQLIDFGCAAQKNVELSHFRGCPPFAHDDLLHQGLEKWRPDEKHDMASLSFTIASLLAESSVPWFGFNGCNIEPGRLKERSTIATKLLCNDKLNKTTRNFLIKLIDESSVGSQKRLQKRQRGK